MKNFGILIIKPDACDEDSMNEFRSIMEKHDLAEYNVFNLKNFVHHMREYRKADVTFRKGPAYAKGIGGSEIALRAYNELYAKPHGYVVLVNIQNFDKSEAFKKLHKVKWQFKEKLEASRGYVFAYTNYRKNPILREMTLKNYEKTKENDPSNIIKAFVNGIHLEDKECFEANVCLDYMRENNILTQENLLYRNKDKVQENNAKQAYVK